MAGLNISLTDIEFTNNLGLALPVTRGLMRYFLPGSADYNDTDQAGSGFSGILINGTANNTRDAHDVMFTPGPTYALGGYDLDIPLASTPKPPITLISVGYNGATLGNYFNQASDNSQSLLDVIDGVLGTNTQTATAIDAGYTGPTITLDSTYSTQFQFFAAVLDWASGGNATQTLYYGRGGTLTTASASQAAVAQSSSLTRVLSTGNGRVAAKNGSITSGQRGVAHLAAHNVALTPTEIAASYAWLRRYFSGTLPNNGL
jgi:hypothetical protein